MSLQLLGYVLMALGAAIFVVGRMRPRTDSRSSVNASNGSVAAGGNINAPITTSNSAQPASPSHDSHALTLIAILVEVVAIAVTVYTHFIAAK